MKQKIVLKVDMAECEKLRMKAMRIASGSHGVTSVSVQGQNDQLVVLGVGIDTAELTRELRKKVGHTSIITVTAQPQSQSQPQSQQQQQYSEVRKCTCEIPYSGYCGFCKSMNQNYYHQAVGQPYYPPVAYGGYRENEGCNIM